MTFKTQMGDDSAVFFNTDEFADEATIGLDTVNGIFDHEYIEALDVSGEAPVFVCATSDLDDLGGVTQGDTLTVNGTGYRIRSVEPDGTGVTRLTLEEV